MLAARVDKKKILEYSAILGIIFLIMGYVIVTNFIIKPGIDKNTNNNVIKITPVKEVGELKVKIIENNKFKNLKENIYKKKNLEDLNVGKNNPFTPEGKAVKTKD